MSFTRLAVLFTISALACATVIQTDAQVTASISVKANTNNRNFVVSQILNVVTSFGYASSVNVSSGSGSTSQDNVYVSSYAGILGMPNIDWGHYQSTSSWNIGAGTATAASSLLLATFRPLAVVQYVDNNNNGKYDVGEEYAVKTLNQMYSTSVSQNSDKTVWIVSYDANNFGFRYSVQDGTVQNQGVNVDSNSVKVDVWIRPQSKAQNNGKVALLASFSTAQSDSNIGGNVNNGNVTVTGGGNVRYTRNGVGVGISWAGSASSADQNGNQGTTKVTTDVLSVQASASLTINGQTIISANLLTNIPKVFVFNFDATNPSEIYWDPTLGGSSSASSVAVSVLAIIFAIALFL